MVKKAAIVFLSFLLFLSLSSFGFAFTLNRTILNSEFLISEVDELDVPVLVEELLRGQVPEEVTTIASAEFIDRILNEAVITLEPWGREQIDRVIDTLYDYLLGRSENLNLVIRLDEVKEVLRDIIWQALLESPPPIIQEIPFSLVERYFDQFYDEVSAQMPAAIEINEDFINELSPDIMPLLEQARRYIGYLQIVFWASIASIALTIMGIILLNRQVRGATRWLGIPCLISGIVTFVSTFVIKHFAGVVMTQLYLPDELKDWAPRLLNDSLALLQIYGIVFMAVGTALLIVSIVYRRCQ